jgi:hypothetical protein
MHRLVGEKNNVFCSGFWGRHFVGPSSGTDVHGQEYAVQLSCGKFT